jgi:hypothetical protein
MSHSIRMSVAISVMLLSGVAAAQPYDESAVPPPRPIALVKSGMAIEGRAARYAKPGRFPDDRYRPGLPVVLGDDCPPARSARDEYKDEADYGPLGSVDVPHRTSLS